MGLEHDEWDINDALFYSKVFGFTKNEEVIKRYARQGSFESRTGFNESGRRLPLAIDNNSFLSFISKRFIVEQLKNRTKESLKNGYIENENIEKASNVLVRRVFEGKSEEIMSISDDFKFNRLLSVDINLSYLEINEKDLNKVSTHQSKIDALQIKYNQSIHDESSLEEEFNKKIEEFGKVKVRVYGLSKTEVFFDFEDFRRYFLIKSPTSDYEASQKSIPVGMESVINQYNHLLLEKDKLRKEIKTIQEKVIKKFKQHHKLFLISNTTIYLIETVMSVFLGNVVSGELQLKLCNQLIRSFAASSYLIDKECLKETVIYNVKERTVNIATDLLSKRIEVAIALYGNIGLLLNNLRKIEFPTQKTSQYEAYNLFVQ